MNTREISSHGSIQYSVVPACPTCGSETKLVDVVKAANSGYCGTDPVWQCLGCYVIIKGRDGRMESLPDHEGFSWVDETITIDIDSQNTSTGMSIRNEIANAVELSASILKSEIQSLRAELDIAKSNPAGLLRDKLKRYDTSV